MVVSIFFRYVAWHYTRAPVLMYQVWKNLLWYIGHVFSVGTLWRSLFSPWRRIVAQHTKRWDLEDLASAALANLISRLVGAFMRSALIVCGLSLQFLWILFGIVFYKGWYLLPLLLALTFGYGLFLIL